MEELNLKMLISDQIVNHLLSYPFKNNQASHILKNNVIPFNKSKTLTKV